MILRIFRRLSRGLIRPPVVACLFLVFVAHGSDVRSQPHSAPALWSIEAGSSTVYLMGTIHLLKGGEDWYHGAIKRAFETADSLTLEIAPAENSPAIIAPLVQKHGLYGSGDRLSNHISKSSYDKLKEFAREAGVPTSMLERFRPWYAALVVSIQYGQAQGFKPTEGVDHRLSRMAQKSRKPVLGLETAAHQIEALAGYPPRIQQLMLDDTVRQLEDLPTLWQGLVDAWLKGNLGVIEELLIKQLKAVPEVYETVLVRRNRDWVAGVKERLGQPGTHFIAVGTGHLVGPDSLLVLMAQEGFPATRH